jgi:hypothetical protein
MSQRYVSRQALNLRKALENPSLPSFGWPALPAPKAVEAQVQTDDDPVDGIVLV